MALAGAKSLGSYVFILQAEAWALIEGLKGAAHLGIKNIEIEGDNLDVINAVYSVWQVPWKFNNIVCDIGVQLSRFAEWRVSHCFREANKVADFMTVKGHNYLSLLY